MMVCWDREHNDVVLPPAMRVPVTNLGMGAGLCGTLPDGGVRCEPWLDEEWRPEFADYHPQDSVYTDVAMGSTYSRFGLAANGEIHVWQNVVTVPTGEFQLIENDPSGGNVLCALGVAGDVKCWNSIYDETRWEGDIPAGTYTDISVGGYSGNTVDFAYHACGLRSDATIACWGDNGQGQLNVPGGSDPAP